MAYKTHRKSIKKYLDDKKPLYTGYSNHQNFISFSFKYLDFTDKFNVVNISSTYCQKLLIRLQEISHKQLKELMEDGRYKSVIRMHRINWLDTTESTSGFKNLPHHLQDIEPWQFSVTSNEHGRVHGFFIENTFYVVWVDPQHELYE